MEWLRWCINLVEIIFSFSMHLKSPKSEFRWKKLLSKYKSPHSRFISIRAGPYAFPYDPYTPDQKIQTEMAAVVWLIFILYKTPLGAFLGHHWYLSHHFQFLECVLMFERDLALQGAKFKDLHAKSEHSTV
jgi:hypothetical protein